MMDNPTVVPKAKVKALRIQLPSGDEAPLDSPLRSDAATPTQTVVRKSILKNRCDEPLPNDTKEADPLQSESYFEGPLRTLITSVDNVKAGMISMHDITEAYILLACRIEAQASNLTDDSAPAVVAVRRLPSHLVCAAIRRDVARAISGTGSLDLGDGLDTLSDQQRVLNEEGRSHVKDRSSLCHAALRFLAYYFRFPSLHCLLKLHELAWILKELLDVGLSHDLYTLNSQKTYSHVIAILSSQRLHESALKPFRSKIAAVVVRAASGDMEGNAISGPHLDGLRANYCLLHRYGPLLFSEFSMVLKVVLQNLVCPVPAFRDLAAKSLTAFAHAILRSDISVEDQHKCSSIIGAFIDKETHRAKEIQKGDPNAFVLRDFLKLKEEDPRIIQRITQLLNIAASLLVLSGPCVFARPNSLKLLVKAIEKTQSFRQREMNLLRAATWSCLVRAYGLLSLWDIPKDAGLEESAFQVIRQEYREDVGISVIAVLLGPLDGRLAPASRAQEAITYLYHLGQMPETRSTAAILLRRLLGGVLNDVDSETCTWSDPASIIPEWLSDGLTLELEPRKLKKALASQPGLDILTVRIFEAEELVSTWRSMVEVFQVLAVGKLFDKKTENSLQDDSLLLWRALLKVQNALVPSFSRTVVTKHVLSCLASALCAFLDATHARYCIRPAQSLTATLQLWKLVNDELGELWGAAVASSIYRRLLKNWQFEISGNAMRDEWASLSRALLLAAPKRTLQVLLELKDARAERVIWLDMVRNVRFMEHPPKEVISNLLLFPIQASEVILLDDMDFSYWDILFMLGLMHDEPDNVFSMVAQELIRAVPVKACHDLRGFFTTSIVHASRSDSSPSLALLSATSDYLEDAYPPENCEENEFTELIPSLQRIIHTFSSLDVLKSLKNGMIPWFQDKKSLIPDATYNNDILPLYCDLFPVLRKIRPIEDTIIENADVLAAPFSRERIPDPATGPIAFKEFWDDVAPTLDFRSRNFPPLLTDCVVCLHNAYGGYIPEWMESQLESLAATSPQAEEVVPASVDDIESSDFSPIAASRAKAREQARTPDNNRRFSKAIPNQTPEVSPSIGEPSPQSARFRPNVTMPSPPVFIDAERVKKKRKVQSPTATGISPANGDEPARPDRPLQESGQVKSEQRPATCSSPGATPFPAAEVTARMSDEDYSSWEIPVASQEVREALDGGGDKTPPPRCSNPERRTVVNGELSRALGATYGSEHRINRSQTAPATLQTLGYQRAEKDRRSNEQPPVHAKLRRARTTTAMPLDELEKLHARLSEETRDMETQDLAQATKLTYDVLGILNEKMSEKLENRK